MKLRHVSTAFLVTCLLLLCSQGRAEVIVTGDVSPSGATDPWVIGVSLFVGQSGEGTLNVETGGVVSNRWGSIGGDSWGASGVGTVTVNGEGSEWNNSGGLRVGTRGEGTLNIEDGGVVSNAGGVIGYLPDSVGTVTVTGEGSEWNNSGWLSVGTYGDGTLNISDGGTVNVAGQIQIATLSGSSGVINLDNGTLNIGGLYLGSLRGSNLQGAGTINTHGLVSDLDLIFDRQSSLSQFWTLDDPGQNISLNLEVDGTGIIGVEGTALLRISGGVHVESHNGYVGGTVTVTGEGSEWNNSSLLNVYSGALNIESGGVVSNSKGEIDSGTVTVTGEGSQWNNSSDLTVGYFGVGTLNVEAGGVVSNSDGYIGRQYYHSTVTVAGEGSAWNNSGSLYVGKNASGTLNIEAGGVVSNSDGYIGIQNRGSGTVTVTGEGSLWNNLEDLYVGHHDEGAMNITDGGVVHVVGTTELGTHSALHIELSATTGWPSLLTDSLELGGTLEISLADGFLPDLGSTFDMLDFNTVSGSFAEMNLPVLEGGLFWDASQLLVDGTLSLMDRPPKVVAVGDVMPAGFLKPDPDQWEIDGELKIGDTGEGTLNITDGGVVSNTWSVIGYQWYSVGTVTVTGEGSEWNNSSSLDVGASGTGTLNITDEGTVNVTEDTRVGSLSVINFDNGTLNTGGLISSLGNLQGTGTINTHGLVSDVNLIFDRPSSLSQSFTLDDPGQNISLNLEVDGTADMGVGYGGTALLGISGGVKVESLHGYLGYKAGSNGTAFVVGVGSEWNNSETLHVGGSGNGILNIEAGGVVSTGNGYIGFSSSSVGTVTVTGEGSEWNNSSNLTVGNQGTGTLNITDGGVVSNTDGYIGGHQNYPYGAPDSVGTVTVTGEGSEWNNSSSLYVGYLGEGTLNIEAGGVVSSSMGYIGGYQNYPYGASDSVGTVTVTGEGSEWNNSEDLTVGNSGEGTLNIEDGGVVNVAGTTTLNNSTLQLALSDTTSGPFLITDSLEVDGTLEISLADGFVPELGNTFDILDFNTVSGSFAEMNLPELGNGLLWDTSQLLVDGSLSLPSLPDVFAVGDVSPSGATDPWVIGGDLTVGDTSEGLLNIKAGGVVSNTRGSIGFHAGSVGTVTVTGEGSLWNNLGVLMVGRSGSGTLNIEAGGVVANRGGVIGHQGSTGTVTVTGEGSEWNNSEDLTVGLYGSGTLNIEDGGAVSSAFSNIGYGSDSVGTVTVTGVGSEWNNSTYLYVGNYGEGTLNITDGGVVTTTSGYIGYQPDSVGTVTVTGEGAEWNNLDLLVGGSGTGTLNIEGGGVVNVTRTTTLRPNSTLHIELSDTTSGPSLFTDRLVLDLWSNYGGTLDISLADGFVPELGSTFDILDFNTVSGSFAEMNLPALGVGLGWDTSQLLVDGALLLVDSQTVFAVGDVSPSGATNPWLINGDLKVGETGEGTLNITDGGYVYNDGESHIGSYSGSVGTVTVTGEGSEWNNSDRLWVGWAGEGTLNITDGGVVSNTWSVIGHQSSSVGTVTVTGEGSEWNNSGVLMVGGSGEGTLNISDGGVVSNSDGYIGYQVGRVGTVTVTGEGSEWNNSSDLYVGRYGDGTLNIEAGGVVSNGNGYICDGSSSMGTVTVTGKGSEWNNSGLYVGRFGEGTLNISDGGVVSNSEGFIGSGSDSVGTVTVTGEGSEWNNSGVLLVGSRGNGTLNITDGGVVTDSYGSIGNSPDSVGTVTVTGEGSEWNNSEDLTVGYSGEGTLNIMDGGVVNVAETTTLNHSTLHIELSHPTSGPSLVTNILELDGTLEISLADGFVPELGNTFDILDFNTVSGNFFEMNLPALEDGLLWDTSQRKLLIDGTICVGACIPLAGDFNVDGVVNSADYTRWKDNLENNSLALNGNGSGAATVVQADYDLWKDNFGRSGAGIGDFNSDGTVDAADFTVWQDNLGLSSSALNGNGSGAATVVQADYLLWKTNFEALASGSEGTAAVPEPTTLLLALLALTAAPLRMRCG